MSLGSTDGLRLFELGRQTMATALALLGQEVPNFVDSLAGD